MTIYALSSGPGVSGIAVIRVSGSDTKSVIKHLTKKNLPVAKMASLRKFTRIFRFVMFILTTAVVSHL